MASAWPHMATVNQCPDEEAPMYYNSGFLSVFGGVSKTKSAVEALSLDHISNKLVVKGTRKTIGGIKSQNSKTWLSSASIYKVFVRLNRLPKILRIIKTILNWFYGHKEPSERILYVCTT